MTNLEKTLPAVKFFPAFFVEPIDKLAEYPSETLPHRITLFPPLEQAWDQSIGDELKRLVNPLSPFWVTVGDNDMFGEKNDIPVKKLMPSDRLLRLYGQLASVLENLTHDRTFLPYTPHISVKNHDDIVTGMEIFIEGFTILEKEKGANWIVRDQTRLKGETCG